MNNALESYNFPIVQAPVWTLKTAEPFCNLFPIRETVLSKIIDDMKKNGFDAGHPIVVWNMTVVDGHTRLRAALAAGIETVPVGCRNFTDEDEALEYAIKIQREIQCRRRKYSRNIFKKGRKTPGNQRLRNG